MSHSLEGYRMIAERKYISNIQDHLFIHRFSELSHCRLFEEVVLEKDRIRIGGFDIWGSASIL